MDMFGKLFSVKLFEFLYFLLEIKGFVVCFVVNICSGFEYFLFYR